MAGPSSGKRDSRIERRLAAILIADIAGYSKRMGKDETGTLIKVKTLWKEQFEPRVVEHHGRIVKLMGDGALAEFPSVIEAVHSAIAIQRDAGMRNVGAVGDDRIDLRIGINLGDIIVEEGDVYGEGVNVAARLETLSPLGGIAISATAHEHISGKIEIHFESFSL